MKRFITIVFLFLPFLMVAQKIKKFDFEIGLGHSFAASKVNILDNEYKVGFHLEGRRNLSSIPISIGMHLGYTTLTRVYLFQYQYRSFSVLPIADYNFKLGRKINPIVGLGTGVAFNNIGGVFNEGFKTNLCVLPRIGVRFVNHLSLTVDYQLTHKDYSHANLNLGYYF